MPPTAKRILPTVVTLHLLALLGCNGDKPPDAQLTREDRGLASTIAAAASQGVGKTWAACATCHGAQGQGNQALNAPALVNQSPWYLKRQLRNFRSGLRGVEAGDVAGVQMAVMAKSLPDDNAVDALVEHIEALPASMPATTVTGDAANGRDHYDMICGACHGPGAEGNKLLNAPRLAGIDDWYLIRQYRNFANGVRGSHLDDKYGRQMQRMSRALPDDEVINNVFAYIQEQGVKR